MWENTRSEKSQTDEELRYAIDWLQRGKRKGKQRLHENERAQGKRKVGTQTSATMQKLRQMRT